MDMNAFYGILIPFIGTSAGAACVFFMKKDLIFVSVQYYSQINEKSPVLCTGDFIYSSNANFLIFQEHPHRTSQKNRSIGTTGKTYQHSERKIMYSLSAKKED